MALYQCFTYLLRSEVVQTLGVVDERREDDEADHEEEH